MTQAVLWQMFAWQMFAWKGRASAAGLLFIHAYE